MRFSTSSLLATALFGPLVVSAAPLKRTTDAGTMTVLNFANVLENLETEYYKQGLAKFKSSDYSDAGFSSPDGAIQEITTIQIDESTHATALEAIIVSFGGKPVEGCSFDFSSVLTDVETMISTARLVEHVGVGAYLGAAHLVEDPRVLTAAASIATVESRHGTMLNLYEGATPISSAFDIPLLPNEVLAIAGGFIKGCDLGIAANPSLSVTNTGSVSAGTSLTFSSPALNSSTDGFHCQMLAGGMPFSLSLPINDCKVPEGLNGLVAIWITSDDQPLNGGVIDRQSNAIVAGPLMTFIDIEVDQESVLIRNKGSKGSNDSGSSSNNSDMTSSFTSTTTVSPSDAAAIVSGFPLSTLAPSASGDMSMPTITPSAAPNGAIANGVSMIPKPT